MFKALMLALALLLSTAWLQAQEQYPQAGSNQKEATASDQVTVQGCLQGSDGNYTVTDNSGTTYQLQGDTSKLSAHVGHEVQITGTTSGAGATNPNAGAGTTNPTTGTPTAGAQQSTLTVQNMKHISKTCKSASPK
jgi:Protein of unknown function (DUF5818)